MGRPTKFRLNLRVTRSWSPRSKTSPTFNTLSFTLSWSCWKPMNLTETSLMSSLSSISDHKYGMHCYLLTRLISNNFTLFKSILLIIRLSEFFEFLRMHMEFIVRHKLSQSTVYIHLPLCVCFFFSLICSPTNSFNHRHYHRRIPTTERHRCVYILHIVYSFWVPTIFNTECIVAQRNLSE